MKKSILLCSVVLAACSSPEQQSSVPMDMKTVQEYQQRVASGNTVNPRAKQDEQELNHSDRVKKVEVHHHYHQPRIRPSIGYYHGFGGYNRSGIGLGLGYY